MNSLEEKINSYKTPIEVTNLIKKTKIIFLVGITAAGKDTILRQLIKNHDYHHIVSHTTRAPRENHGFIEIDGQDYHFIDTQTAETMLDNNGYVEAKMFSGNIYGTSIAEIKMAHDEGKIAITDIEVQGVEEYEFLAAKSVTSIFILPPDFDTWQKRLAKRHEENHMDPTELKKRLETAGKELKDSLTKNYFEYVVNDDLDIAVKIVDEIAHGNFSAKKNEQAKLTAKKLLDDLDKLLKIT